MFFQLKVRLNIHYFPSNGQKTEPFPALLSIKWSKNRTIPLHYFSYKWFSFYGIYILVSQSFGGKLYVLPIESAFEYSLLSIKWSKNRTIPCTTFHQMVKKPNHSLNYFPPNGRSNDGKLYVFSN